MYVDDIKLAGKIQNVNPTWTFIMKDVDLGEPTSFLHVYLGCTQRECQISKDNEDNDRGFESWISARAKEKTTYFGPTTWKVTPRIVWKDIANLQIKRLINCTDRVATPCMDDHQVKEEENESVG